MSSAAVDSVVGHDPLADWRLHAEPYYRSTGDEIARFEAVHSSRLPLLLKGPTGGGKSRFVEYMAWRLQRPLVSIACHADFNADDMLGRWRVDGDGDGEGTRWQDGPLTLAARHGAICHLDAIGGACSTVMVAIHSLIDRRRVLPLSNHDEIVRAHADFQLVMSVNRTAAALWMDASTRQRFCALQFDPPEPEVEAGIVARESGLDIEQASAIVAFGVRTRRLQGTGLDDGASTRMLVHAAQLRVHGLSIKSACELAMVDALSDDHDVREALQSALDASF